MLLLNFVLRMWYTSMVACVGTLLQGPCWQSSAFIIDLSEKFAQAIETFCVWHQVMHIVAPRDLPFATHSMIVAGD